MRCVFYLISIVLLISTPAMAERGYFQPPEPVSFDQTQYFDKEYLEDLEDCRQKFQAYNATDILAQLDQLTNLFTEVEVLSVIADVKAAKETYDNLDLRADTDVADSLKNLENFVKYDGFYNAELVNFEVDSTNREYIVSWVDENGDPVVRHIPFVPEVSVKVNAALLQADINGVMAPAYQYDIENDAQSDGSISELYLESKFSDTIFRGTYIDDVIINENFFQMTWLPIGGSHYFVFNFYENNLLWGIAPGASTVAPFKLINLVNTLPGIIHAYLSIYQYSPEDLIDYNSDPEAAFDIFETTDDTETKHMYKGTTIGPVPVPTDYNKSGFIQTIIGYNQQAIDEGWVEDAAVATYTTNTLQAIAADPDNTAQINTFLSQIEGHYTDGKLLSEAYALLKYNLEYLLSRN